MSATDLLPADHEELATSRLAVYRFLLAAFDKPSAEQHAWIAGPAFRQTLEELGDKFGVAVPAGDLAAADPADHEARYIACFEVGLPEPPVVLAKVKKCLYTITFLSLGEVFFIAAGGIS